MTVDPGGRPAFNGPQPFGRYELLVEMGYGGMATLYLARMSGPSNFEKLLAIKKIHDELVAEPQMVEMFLDEARISARIQHPNVVQIFEFDEVQGAHYMAMEYVHGHDFAALIQAAQQNPDCSYRWSHAVRVVADAAAGLHAAHELTTPTGGHLNLVHRDVSPQNLLISYHGYVKVADFGIAQAVDKLSKTLAGTVKGKVAYMSPEQVRGVAVDRRTDVFALGIVLWEAVTLQRLFREPTDVATMRRVSQADVPQPRSIRSDVPIMVERAIMKALSLNPDDRFQTADEMRRALEKAMSSSGELVGASELDDLMVELFTNLKTRKDLEIRQAAMATAVDNPALIMETLAAASGTPPTGTAATAAVVPAAMVTAPGQPTPSAPGSISPDGRRGPAPSGPQPSALDVARASSGGLPAVKTPSGAGGQVGQAAGEVTSPERRKRRSVRSTVTLILAASAVLILLAIVVLLVLRGMGDKTPRAGRAGDSAMKPAPKEKVQLTFYVSPKDASLTLDGQVQEVGLGTFKRVVVVKRSEKPIQAMASAEGYTSRASTVLPVKDQVVTLTLVRDVPRPRPPEARTPVDAGVMEPAPRQRRRTRRRSRRRPRRRSRAAAMRRGIDTRAPDF